MVDDFREGYYCKTESMIWVRPFSVAAVLVFTVYGRISLRKICSPGQRVLFFFLPDPEKLHILARFLDFYLFFIKKNF